LRRALRVSRIERAVRVLGRSVAFYEGALGFCAEAVGAGEALLRRGKETLVLREGGVEEDVPACDQGFQHIALPVSDMAAAMARLHAFAPRMISLGGAQALPESSGGVIAVKFRDPDGHPVEFLQFPDGRAGGIDHSAIVVADVERSVSFYMAFLGLRVAARQVNRGIEQDRLDGLVGVEVEVVALQPEQASPHVELLGYRVPPVSRRQPAPGFSTRLVFEVDGGARQVAHDPDGHEMLLQANEVPVF
jgi:catechol 2,3-dioxygenase-like lactoylglutathione lyase family enzyme